MTNLSVTGIIHSYHLFDKEFWLSYKTLELMIDPIEWEVIKPIILKTKRFDDKYFQNVDKELFDINRALLETEWKLKNEEAKAIGISTHEMIHNELITDISQARSKYGILGDINPNQAILNATDCLFPELRLEISLDEEYTLVGVPDLIYIHDGLIDIIDWKTDEKGIKFKSKYDTSQMCTKRMKYPISKLDDVNGIHYLLLLSIYMYMLLTIRPDLKPGKLKIVEIKNQKVKKTHEVEYLEDVVDCLLKWHLKNLKLKIETDKCREIEYV